MKQLKVLENNNERVLTTKQLAEVYETEANNIKNNFNNNKERFIEGKHYYKLTGKELKEFKREVNDIDLVASNVNQLYLWTEKGASRMCKILDTDRAWDRFDELEDTYFKVKEIIKKDSYMIDDPIQRAKAWIAEEEERQRLLLLVEENKEKVSKWDKFLNTDGLINIGDFGKIIGIGRNTLFKKLKDMKILQDNRIPYQRYMKYFEVKSTVKNNKTFNVALINKIGIDYLSKKLGVC